MTAKQWVNNEFSKQVINEDIYASTQGIIESHIKFATQLLSDYTHKIVENAEVTSGEGIDIENVSVDKESITNQLPEFLKTII